MAVTKTINGSVSNRSDLYTYQAYCEEILPSDYITTNKSKLKVTIKIVTGGNSGTTYASRSASATHTVTINNKDYTFTTGSYNLVGQTTTELGSVTSDLIEHGTDGSKTISVSASSPDLAQGGGYGPYSGSASGNVTLTTIPRYTTIKTFTASKRDNSSLTINWATADTIDYVWYRYKTSSASSYSSWAGYDVDDGTSGSFNVGSLSANTTYNFQLRVRRKDSQLTTDSTTDATQTTYKTPTQSLSSKTETTIKMAWSIDSNADYIWYSTNNGSSWTAVGSIDATSGTYTISGLSPNTTYNVRTRIRRKTSQTTYDITATSVTTYKVPTQSLSSATETSMTMAWTCDSTVSKVEYSTDGGTNYTTVTTSANATSGTYTISNLSANKTYNIVTRLTRSATSTNYPTTSLSVTTYQYPYVKSISVSNLTIGNEQTLTLYNPLGRTITILMKKDSTSGTQLYSATTSSKGDSVTYKFTPTANTLYASIPSATSGNAVYYCTYSSQTVKTESGTYTIKGDEYPTFNASDWSYTTNLTDLTKNNQVAIDKYATITVKIDNSATSSYQSTIDKYLVKWGDTSVETTGTSATISGGSGNTLTVIAYDKRGLPSQEASKTITNVAYTDINITSIETPRTNGVEAGVKLNFYGRMYNGTFGSDGVANALSSAKYYTSTDGTNWSTAYPSDNSLLNAITVSNGTFRVSDFTIHANGSSGGFTIGQQYYVMVQVKDGQGLLATAIARATVTDGKISRSVFKTSDGNYHQGINGLPDVNYNDVVHGTLNVTNQIYKNGNPLANVATSGSYTDLSNKPTIPTNTSQLTNDSGFLTSSNGIKVTRGTSTSTKQYGFWASMARSDQTGSPVLPTTGQWWHILSMDWNNNYSAWISQLALPTNDGGVPFYRRNNSNGTDIDSSTWHRFITDENIGSQSVSYATNAGNTAVTTTNPTSGTFYGVTFTNGFTGNLGQRANNGLQYYTLEGTASAVGQALLQLGNSTASGTVGNKRGRIRIYSQSTGYCDLYHTTNATGETNLFLPNNASGYTLQTKPKNLYNNTSGSTGTITLSETSANFTYIEIFYGKYGDYLHSVRVYSPNGKQATLISGYRYQSSFVQLMTCSVKISGTSITHSIDGGVSINAGSGGNTIFTGAEMTIMRVDGYK